MIANVHVHGTCLLGLRKKQHQNNITFFNLSLAKFLHIVYNVGLNDGLRHRDEVRPTVNLARALVPPVP